MQSGECVSTLTTTHVHPYHGADCSAPLYSALLCSALRYLVHTSYSTVLCSTVAPSRQAGPTRGRPGSSDIEYDLQPMRSLHEKKN